MDALFYPSKLSGSVRVPGSKSYTHRVVMAAALYGGDVTIKNPSNSDANRAMIRLCQQFGATVRWNGSDLCVHGVGGRPTGGGTINVGNSGTAFRISISFAALADNDSIITGDPSLQSRPAGPLLTALTKLGADIRGTDRDGIICAPIYIKSNGDLDGGSTQISCVESSQYLTSLLLVANFAKRDVKIQVTDRLVSRPYVRMTLEVLCNFGIKVDVINEMYYVIQSRQSYTCPSSYVIPGDYSQAAFFLAAACLVESDVRVQGLNPQDQQGDKRIVDILREMGAVIDQDGSDLIVRGPFDLNGISIDLVDTPDLFPVLAVLGIYARGRTRLYNMPQIRTKETDRIFVMMRELSNCGVNVESKSDEMTIYHTDINVRDHVFSAKGVEGVTDHRIAMALSLIGIRSGTVLIRAAEKIAISYPGYIDDMQRIGARIDIIN